MSRPVLLTVDDDPAGRLYPVLDELLQQWATRPRPSFAGITVLIHQWSAETQTLEEFLAHDALPVMLPPDDEVQERPSLQDVAARAGLSTSVGSPSYDLVVVSGGPAGPGASEGLRMLLPLRATT